MSDKDNQDDIFDDFGVSPLKMAATNLHELYVELRSAGFTRNEALTLVAKMIAGGFEATGGE